VGNCKHNRAVTAGIGLRQNYNRLAPRVAGQVGRYAHARKFKRMRKALRRLKGYTDRVLRGKRCVSPVVSAL